MPERQIGVNALVSISTPHSMGYVTENKEAFARVLGFRDPSASESDTHVTSDVLVHYDLWRLNGTEYIKPIGGINLIKSEVPEDFSTENWITLADDLHVITTTKPIDPFGTVHCYIRADVINNGQNQSYMLPTGEIVPPQSTSSDNVSTTHTSQISKRKFNRNEGWKFDKGEYLSITSDFLNPALVSQLSHGLGLFLLGNLIVAALDDIVNITRSYSLIRWSVGSASGVEWALIIPKKHEATRMSLLKSIDGGQTFFSVSQYPTDQLDQFTGVNGMTISNIRYTVENGTAIFKVGGDKEWTFQDPQNPLGFVADEGNVQFDHYGSAAFWNIMSIHHIVADPSGKLIDPAGTATLSGGLQIPPTVNPDSSALTYYTYPHSFNSNVSPDYTVDAVALELDDQTNKALNQPLGSYIVKVSYHNTGAGEAKGAFTETDPVLLVEEVRKADVQAETVQIFSAQDDVTSISWNLNRELRGNTIKIVARNDTGKYSSLGGNEVVALSLVGVFGDDTNAPFNLDPYVAKFAGFISKVSLKHNAKDSGFISDSGNLADSLGLVEIQCEDWTMRLKKVPMADTPSYGGWELQDALINILNKCGVHPSFYDFDPNSTQNVAKVAGIGTGYRLPAMATSKIGKGHTDFFYSDRVSAIHAMDEMCGAKGFTWGVDEAGVIRAWRASEEFDRTPSTVFVLDDTNYNPDQDCITAIDVEKDIDQFYNSFVSYSSAKDGTVTTSDWTYHASAFGNYGDPDYVGSKMVSTYRAPSGMEKSDLDNFSLTRWYKSMHHVQLLKWESTHLGAIESFPRDLVVVSVTGLGVHGSPFNVFQIISEEGQVVWDGESVKTKITRILRAMPALLAPT